MAEDKKQIQEIQKQMEGLMARLDQVDRGLLRGTIKRLQEGGATLEEWNRELKRFRTSADELSSSLDYISKSFRDTVAEISKSNTQLSKSKSILNQIDKTASTAAAVRRGEQDINRKNIELAKQKVGQQREDLQTAIESGKLKKAEVIAIQDAINNLNEYSQSLEDILKIDKKIENSIGISAGILKGVDKALQKAGFSSLGISDAFNKTKREAQEIAFQTGKMPGSLKLMGMFSKNLFENFKNALTVTKLLEAAIFAIGKAIMFIDKNSGALAKQLGISNVQARELIAGFNDISATSKNTFINTKNLTEAFGQLTQSLGVAKLASDAILESQVKLTKQAGYSAESATELAKLGAIQNTDAEGLLSNFLGQTEALNMQNGLQLNSKQLAESALKTSKATLLSLGGQGKALGEAAFEAKKLGLSLQQIEGVADSLLSIESSIAAEFEAEVITGRQLNLERARYYALTNDIAGLAKEINAQGITAVGFGKMGRIEQEAIAKAFGMSRDAMGEMLYEQEALSKLSGIDGDNAKEKFNNLVKQVGLEEAKRRLGNSTLANQMASTNIQERFTAAMEKLQTLFLTLAEPLMPVLDIIINIVSWVSQLAKDFKGVFMTIGAIYGISKGLLLINKAIAFFSGIANKNGVIANTLAAVRLGQEEGIGAAKTFQLALEQSILGKLILQGIQQAQILASTLTQNIATAYRLTLEETGSVLAALRAAMEQTILGSLIAQGARFAYNIVKEGILLGIKVAQAAADVTSATMKTYGIGTGPLIAIALAAAAALAGGIYALTKGNDVYSPATGGSGYGSRMLLGPEGAIALNNKDTVIAGTKLFKGDDVVSAPAGSVQMAPEIDYNRLASAIGGAVNDKQVTLSYTDFAQKTRPVFG